MSFFRRWGRPARKSDFDYESLDVLGCLISYNRYGAYCVPSSSASRPAAQKILSGRVYEPETIEFMVANCKNGDIVQAGAYFGDFLPALSKACSENSKIWSFEPNSENYRCARLTLELNGIENVELHNIGLGSEIAEADLRVEDNKGAAMGGGSRILEKADSEGNFEKIRIRPIDEVIGPERMVSIIQLDVEGFEIKALMGAMKTIARCKPILIIETLPGSTAVTSPWFKEHIIDLGYRETGTLSSFNLVFSTQ